MSVQRLKSSGLFQKRHGVSALEFIGATAALAGGMVLGSIYLGIDVKTAATRLLDRQAASTVIESSASVTPEAATPLTAPSAPPATRPAAEEEAADPPTHEETKAVARPAQAFDANLELTEEQRGDVTLTYWHALNKCMKAELKSRTAGVKAGGDWKLYDYLQARNEGHRVAAEAIDKLNNNGVDSHVLAYRDKALAWHQEGAELYARAKDLLTDAPTAQLSGPFAQSWQSAATQHQMEERLLEERRAAVQAYLDHQGKPSDRARP